MIELKSISKSFDGKSVLSNFSINIEENEFVSIVGKSGSGKTTLLNIISLLDYPDEGKVVILGYENPKSKEVMKLRRENLGYIFQNYVLMDNETVLTNLLLSTAYVKDFDKNKLSEALEMVGLDKSF